MLINFKRLSLVGLTYQLFEGFADSNLKKEFTYEKRRVYNQNKCGN